MSHIRTFRQQLSPNVFYLNLNIYFLLIRTMTKIVENGQNTWGESRHASHGVPSLKGIFGIEIERNWICQLRRRRQAP